MGTKDNLDYDVIRKLFILSLCKY